MKISLIRVGGGLRPIGDEAEELYKKFPNGVELIAEIKRNRNPKFHRYAFAMMKALFDMTDEDPEVFNGWRKNMLVQAGEFESYKFKDGTMEIIPSSLSYEKMTEDRFHEAMRVFHQAFITKYGPKIDYDDLLHVVGFM